MERNLLPWWWTPPSSCNERLRDPLSYERIRMAKHGAGALGDSRLINGIILDQRVALDRQPRHLEQVKVAVLTRPLALQKGS